MFTTKDSVLCWHPRFMRHYISDTSLLFIDECENYVLDGEKYRALFETIDSGASIEALLEKSPHLERTIQSLLEKQLLTTQDSPDRYHFEEYSPILEPSLLQVGDLLTYNLSKIHISQDFIKALQVPEPCTLVITDDYLHPQLNEIHQKKQPWLLLKLTGKRCFIGPYFSQKEGAACWQCMASQLLKNQPVRRWLQAKQQIDYLSLPVLDNTDYLQAENISGIIQRAIAQPQTLFEVETDDFTAKAHTVHYRPQCAICGNPALMKQQMMQAVALNNVFTQLDNDGGSRAVNPQATIESLQPFISPLTGCITHFTHFPKTTNTSITIHQAAFFKTPPAYQSIHQTSFVQPSLGKGISHLQSQASALCEAVERYAAYYQGDEYWAKAKPADLDARHYLPEMLVNFSESQYQSFANASSTILQQKYAVQKYDPNIPLSWTPTWSLTFQEKVWIPFNYGFAHTPFETDHQYIRWNSNGCAAGNNLEEAILQGFFEVIERDAIAIWWYNKIARASIDLEELPIENIAKIEQTLGQAWDFWLLDITTDLGIPVIACVAQHKKTGKFGLGFGCHLNPVIACQRALSELCQLIPIRSQNKQLFDFDAIQEEAFLKPNGLYKTLKSFPEQGSLNLKDDILYCVQKAQESGLEVLVLNYSRPELPIKTAKVIVPGLCHIWPQLGTKRLYEVPLKLGWQERANTETTLHSQALYI